jgi:hypothetical protein
MTEKGKIDYFKSGFEIDPAEMEEWYQTALLSLKYFGIEDLTDIEAHQLRKNIAEAIKQNAELVAAGKARHVVSLDIWPFAHGYENLLLHYGVNLHELPIDPKTGSFRKDPVLMKHLREKIRKAREGAFKPYID